MAIGAGAEMSETTRKLNPSDSHAMLISEMTDYKRHLWTLIAEIKKAAHFVPNRERASLLNAATEAERRIS